MRSIPSQIGDLRAVELRSTTLTDPAGTYENRRFSCAEKLVEFFVSRKSKISADSEILDFRTADGEENKELLREYQRDRTLNGIKPSTVERDLSALKVQSEHLSEPFDEMDKDDVKDLVAWIQRKYDNDFTVSIHKRALRNLFKNLNGGEHPDETDWITTNHNGSNGKLPSDLLTPEEVEAQIEACHNARDKALIAILWETGARIGELRDVTVGDIEDRKHGMKVTIDGKTGSRRLPLVESVPRLNKWLNEHPNPQKDAPLWCKIQQGGPDDQLGYRYIRSKILKRSMNDADVDKPSNPHHYRHSRASHLATKMTEAELCEWFGWVQGSDVPAKYVHLSGRDIDNKYDALHDLVDEEDEEDDESVVECPRCDELNEPDAAFCYRCGFALDVDAAEEIEKVEEEATRTAEADDLELAQKLVAAIRDDPELVDEVLEETSQ